MLDQMRSTSWEDMLIRSGNFFTAQFSYAPHLHLDSQIVLQEICSLQKTLYNDTLRARHNMSRSGACCKKATLVRRFERFFHRVRKTSHVILFAKNSD